MAMSQEIAASGRRIAFRVDASMQIGGGHVMRCLSLAHHLRNAGADCIFVTQPSSIEIIPQLETAGFGIVLINDLSSESTINAMTRSSECAYDWLVVDHYSLDSDFHSAMRGVVRHVMVIDELLNRSCDCDLFVDPAPGKGTADYDRHCPNAIVLAGPRFALLRDSFLHARPASMDRKRWPIKKVLVGIGTVDGKEMAPVLLRGICAVDEHLEIDIFSGDKANSLPLLRKIAVELPNTIKIFSNVTDMAQLMLEQDLVVTAAGSIVWEICCLGLPSITVITSDNQKNNARALDRAAASIVAGDYRQVDEDKIFRLTNKLLNDPQLTDRLSKKAASLCDGQGAERVADVMLKLLEGQ
jgi:UDP-2,4-diacetamido-2,4,6-trideoxy-beta-L-altropyranose hydrolase